MSGTGGQTHNRVPTRLCRSIGIWKETSLIMPRIINCITAFALAALATGTAAHAAVLTSATYYQSLTAFNAAATTATTYTFEGITPSVESNPAVLVTPGLGRITFSVTGGNDSTVYAYDSDAIDGTFRLSDGTDTVAAGRPFGSASTTRIDLDNTYTAFAIEYGMEGNATKSYTFALFNNDTPVGTSFVRSAIGGDNFFGATADAAFNNVRVTATVGGSNSVVFDNARVGSLAAVVPEANSLALALPALSMIALCNRVGAVIVRRRKK